MVKRVSVFCGSSPGARHCYVAAATSLATHLVANKISIVYGGSNVGLMGALADAALEAGGTLLALFHDLWSKRKSHTGGSRICGWSAPCMSERLSWLSGPTRSSHCQVGSARLRNSARS